MTVHVRQLVLRASIFDHVLYKVHPSAGDWTNPLMKLSPARCGLVLQSVAREVMQRENPGSLFQDPPPGTSAFGQPLGHHQAEWDWTMDGRRAECKHARLSWSVHSWRVQFSHIKMAHATVRPEALFDDLFLVLLSPEFIDIVRHDMQTGVCKTGLKTSSEGHTIDIRASRHQLCLKLARVEILDKLCATGSSCQVVSTLRTSDSLIRRALLKFLPEDEWQTEVHDALPLAGLSPPLRALRIQEVALSIDRMLHPTSRFSTKTLEGEVTVSGRRRSTHNASVDWIRDGTKVEVKSSRLSFDKTKRVWRCRFRHIKRACPGVRSKDLYDELWLVIYSPIGLHFIRHHGQFGWSTNGVCTSITGHVLNVAGPAHEVDFRAALGIVLSKLCDHGSLLLATVLWDV